MSTDLDLFPWYHPQDAPYLLKCRAAPVPFTTFIYGERYLARPSGYLWPCVEQELVRLCNPEDRIFSNPHEEAVFCGSIGSGKSLGACAAILYEIHKLLCYRDPATALGLAPGSEIMVALHSVSAGHAGKTDFSTIEEIITTAPYFKDKIVRHVDGEIELTGRIVIRAITDMGGLGQNILAAISDEVNYQARVEASKRSNRPDALYDQASEVYSAISTRRRSRFERQGRTLPGLVCIVSSKRSPEDFTSKKVAESATNPSIFVSDLKLWEARPSGTYSEKMFRVFPGDTARQGRILHDGESLSDEDEALVIEVPENFRPAFTMDLDRALRDIAGIAVSSSLVYFADRAAVTRCFGRTRSVLSRPDCDFATTTITLGDFERPELFRALHFDLSESRDATGAACMYIAGVRRTETGLVPIVKADFCLQVFPPKSGEILQDNLLALVRAIIAKGVALRAFSTDGFQSTALRQRVMGLRTRGGWPVMVGERSTDLKPEQYVLVKWLAYQGALELPDHPALLRELLGLEIQHQTGNSRRRYVIDHRPGASKDCSDALACATALVVTRREAWAQHGHPNPALPVDAPTIAHTSNAETPALPEPKKQEQRTTFYDRRLIGPTL